MPEWDLCSSLQQKGNRWDTNHYEGKKGIQLKETPPDQYLPITETQDRKDVLNMTKEFAANVTFNGGEMEASPLRAEAYFLVYFQNFPESSSHSN